MSELTTLTSFDVCFIESCGLVTRGLSLRKPQHE